MWNRARQGTALPSPGCPRLPAPPPLEHKAVFQGANEHRGASVTEPRLVVGGPCLGHGCADITRPSGQRLGRLGPLSHPPEVKPFVRFAPPIAQVWPSWAERALGGPRDSPCLLPPRPAGTIRPLSDGEAHARPDSDIWLLFYSL